MPRRTKLLGRRWDISVAVSGYIRFTFKTRACNRTHIDLERGNDPVGLIPAPGGCGPSNSNWRFENEDSEESSSRLHGRGCRGFGNQGVRSSGQSKAGRVREDL